MVDKERAVKGKEKIGEATGLPAGRMVTGLGLIIREPGVPGHQPTSPVRPNPTTDRPDDSALHSSLGRTLSQARLNCSSVTGPSQVTSPSRAQLQIAESVKRARTAVQGAKPGPSREQSGLDLGTVQQDRDVESSSVQTSPPVNPQLPTNCGDGSSARPTIEQSEPVWFHTNRYLSFFEPDPSRSAQAGFYYSCRGCHLRTTARKSVPPPHVTSVMIRDHAPEDFTEAEGANLGDNASAMPTETESGSPTATETKPETETEPSKG